MNLVSFLPSNPFPLFSVLPTSSIMANFSLLRLFSRLDMSEVLVSSARKLYSSLSKAESFPCSDSVMAEKVAGTDNFSILVLLGVIL